MLLTPNLYLLDSSTAELSTLSSCMLRRHSALSEKLRAAAAEACGRALTRRPQPAPNFECKCRAQLQALLLELPPNT